MKNKTILITSIVVIELIGIITTLFIDAQGFYQSILLPQFAPPGWVFGIAWTILYLLLGITFSILYQERMNYQLKIFITQMILNFSWSFIFFNLECFVLSYMMIVIMIILTAYIVILTQKALISKLLLPYIMWLLFASYLNLGIIILN